MESEQYDSDNGSFNFQKPAQFKEVVLTHLKKIAEISCCEMRGGYNLIVTDRNGSEREVYIEDSRERYSNAVLTLAHILLGKFDKIMEKKYQEFYDSIETIKGEFINKCSHDEVEIMGEGFYENSQDKVLLEHYKIKKLKIYQDLFAELSLLLGRLNYMEIGGGSF